MTMPQHITLFVNPLTKLHQIKTNPRWLAAFVLLSVLSVILYALTHPYLVEATLHHLPTTATPQEKEVVAQTLRNELPLRCAFLPVRLLVGWSSFAYLLFLLIRSMAPAQPIRFANLFSLEVHCEAVGILGHLATLVSLLLHNAQGVYTPVEVPFSAALIVRPDTIGMFSLLNSLNFFNFVYVLLLSLGISIQSGYSRKKALLIVLVAWSAVSLLNFSVISLLQDTMHLLI